MEPYQIIAKIKGIEFDIELQDSFVLQLPQGVIEKAISNIFQSYNLIDYLTPIENVALTSKQPPLPILKQLGLTVEETKRNVMKLSGGHSNV